MLYNFGKDQLEASNVPKGCVISLESSSDYLVKRFKLISRNSQSGKVVRLCSFATILVT